MRGHANFLAEGPVQMAGAHARPSGQLLKRNAFGIVLVEELFGLANGEVLVAVARQGNTGSAVASGQLVQKRKGAIVSGQTGFTIFHRMVNLQKFSEGTLIFD